MTTVEYLFVVNDVDLEFEKLILYDQEGGYDSIEAFEVDHRKVSKKSMKMAYFFEVGSLILYTREKREQLALFAIKDMSYWIVTATLFFMVMSGWCVWDKSARATKSIIHLYETLDDIRS